MKRETVAVEESFLSETESKLSARSQERVDGGIAGSMGRVVVLLGTAGVVVSWGVGRNENLRRSSTRSLQHRLWEMERVK
jgi:hypothetical protein